MQCFWRSRSLAVVVANDLVNLDDDVFGVNDNVKVYQIII